MTLDLIEVLVQEGVLVLVTLRFFDEVVLTGGVWAASQLLLVGSNASNVKQKIPVQRYRDQTLHNVLCTTVNYIEH